MKTRLLVCFIILSMIVAKTTFAFDPPLEKGKELFSLRCAACHNVNKQLTGPALAGVDERRSMSWIIDFIRSSQSLVKKGDKDAVSVYEKFNKIPMPDHIDLTEENIKDIVAYIKSEAKPFVTETAPFAKPGKIKPAYLPLSIQNDYGFFISYLILIALLIVVLLFAVQVRNFGIDEDGL